MRKRILSILLAIVMVFTMIPSITKADESENVYILPREITFTDK